MHDDVNAQPAPSGPGEATVGTRPLTTGAVFAGLLGAFLAVPLTAMAFAANTELRNQRTVSPDNTSGPRGGSDSTNPDPSTLAAPFTDLIATT